MPRKKLQIMAMVMSLILMVLQQ